MVIMRSFETFGAMNSSAQVTMLGSHCVMTIFDTVFNVKGECRMF
jgi:hypothetical protein